MYSNKKNVIKPATGDEPFEQTREALKNRLRWRIRRAQRTLKARPVVESQAAKAGRAIYAIGYDSLPSNSDCHAEKKQQ